MRSFSIFLIHLFACPCGSMANGQRPLLSTTMPFSMEKASFGSPAMTQDLRAQFTEGLQRNADLIDLEKC